MRDNDYSAFFNCLGTLCYDFFSQTMGVWNILDWDYLPETLGKYI